MFHFGRSNFALQHTTSYLNCSSGEIPTRKSGHGLQRASIATQFSAFHWRTFLLEALDCSENQHDNERCEGN
jgi:hypothetical protein